jgi:hypothetical protein
MDAFVRGSGAYFAMREVNPSFSEPILAQMVNA